MANRQALRELQTRLAGRLQAARTDAAQGVTWLAVQAGGRNYLLPLAQAGEIFPWAGVQPVPYTCAWFWGVANLRGSLVGVIDLAGLMAHAQPRSEPSLLETSLLAINPALQVNAALVVDRLMGLRGVEHFVQSSAPPAAQGLHACLGASYTDPAGEVWQELQLQALVRSPDFLQVRS